MFAVIDSLEPLTTHLLGSAQAQESLSHLGEETLAPHTFLPVDERPEKKLRVNFGVLQVVAPNGARLCVPPGGTVYVPWGRYGLATGSDAVSLEGWGRAVESRY